MSSTYTVFLWFLQNKRMLRQAKVNGNKILFYNVIACQTN